jgi:hypothetical protein
MTNNNQGQPDGQDSSQRQSNNDDKEKKNGQPSGKHAS